jgi:hypothetical protein
MSFTESEHPREAGAFIDKAQTAAEVALDVGATRADISVQLTGRLDLRSGYWEELPEYPAELDAPVVGFDFNDGRVETNIWVDGKAVTFWEGSDGDSYNSLLGDGTFGQTSASGWSEATDEAFAEWGTAVHQRIDSATYGVMIEATSGETRNAILAHAADRDYKPTPPNVADRSNATLEVGDILVGNDGTKIVILGVEVNSDSVIIETAFGPLRLDSEGSQSVSVPNLARDQAV